MKIRLPLILASVALVATAAWFALRPPQLDSISTSSADREVATASSRSASVAPSVGRSLEKPGIRADVPVKFPIAPPKATLFNEYMKAKAYRPLYDRLANTAEGQTAQGKLVLYEMLRQCATITDGPRPGYKANFPGRDAFINNIPTDDPQREKRIAAFDEAAVNRCAGLDGMTMTRADLLKILNDAAVAGDPGARALAIEQEMGENRRNTTTLSDGLVRELQTLASSKDPEAIRVAGRTLANAWPDYALRVGPGQLPVEQRAFVNAFLVLACEYGAPCGTDTPRMLDACAMRGFCDAQNFPDYLSHYGSTPHETAMLVQYRELVRQAIETGDWSQINVVRGQPPNHRMSFQPGPR